MVFPSDCAVCGGPMTAWSATPVCSACVAQVGRQAGALCGICGEALGMESARFAAAMGVGVCTMCRLAPPDYTRAVAYGVFEDELREMLHLLKYERVRRLASKTLGEGMAEAILLLAADAGPELTVIAVPLFAARERQRGFNQSVVLADAAIVRLKKLRPPWKLVASHRALSRVRDTEAQFGLTPRARRRNLLGAFRVLEESVVRGKEVLLVDDIMTTGATARECARVLMRAGAAKVWVATLARAQAESFAGAEPGARDVAMWDAVVEPRKPMSENPDMGHPSSVIPREVVSHGVMARKVVEPDAGRRVKF
ncbi:MAG: ComF family protein [Acidobacteriota bacterium]|nr:ComF family protein [Acidobacteriota bacterium]